MMAKPIIPLSMEMSRTQLSFYKGYIPLLGQELSYKGSL